MAKEPHEIAPNEPYPTGNPPDPMEEYYKAHPERKLAEEQAAQAEKDAKKKTVQPEKNPVDLEEPAKEPEEDNTRKGRR